MPDAQNLLLRVSSQDLRGWTEKSDVNARLTAVSHSPIGRSSGKYSTAGLNRAASCIKYKELLVEMFRLRPSKFRRVLLLSQRLPRLVQAQEGGKNKAPNEIRFRVGLLSGSLAFF